jgi:beta-lactamase regulating signal transducer with metallopeptidase domain
MAPFLIKSAIALALFLGIYYLLLQREKMHRFNRFYLLGAIVVSFILPLISIPVYVEAQAMPALITAPLPLQGVAVPPEESINYLAYVLWGTYALVTLMLIVRFALNIMRFYRIKKHSSTIAHKGTTVVLMDTDVPPHTFLGSIFVSRSDYENRHAEPELFTHELAHVYQRHTLDILFIEAVKTVLWFNPLLYFYKRAMQLNHEFLADAATLSTHHNVTNYQSLLLGRAQPALQLALASSINFSITKKRFIMMTKTTSTAKALLLKLTALPVLAGLVYGLCTQKTLAQTPPPGSTAQTAQHAPDRNDRDAYYSGVRIVVDDKLKGITIDKVYEQLTEAEKDRYMFNVPARNEKVQISAKELEKYKDAKTYAIWIDGKHTANSALSKYKPEDFALVTGSFVHKNARSEKFPQQYQFNLYTHAYYDNNFATFHYPGNTYSMVISNEREAVRGKTTVNHPDAPGRYVTEVTTPPAPQPAQSGTAVVNYAELDVKPEYPGGITAFYKFINANVALPKGVKGHIKTTVSFIVEPDGSISGIKVLKTDNEAFANEIIKVLGKMEKWKPGTIEGQPVRTSYILPVTIMLNN